MRGGPRGWSRPLHTQLQAELYCACPELVVLPPASWTAHAPAGQTEESTSQGVGVQNQGSELHKSLPREPLLCRLQLPKVSSNREVQSQTDLSL